MCCERKSCRIFSPSHQVEFVRRGCLSFWSPLVNPLSLFLLRRYKMRNRSKKTRIDVCLRTSLPPQQQMLLCCNKFCFVVDTGGSRLMRIDNLNSQLIPSFYENHIHVDLSCLFFACFILNAPNLKDFNSLLFQIRREKRDLKKALFNSNIVVQCVCPLHDIVTVSERFHFVLVV